MKPIYVTQPSLPPLDEFIPYLEAIWESGVLTNNGPFHQQLEQELCKYLGVKHVCLFTNGTIALMTALQALSIKGEVITTPYSFIATSHALLWNDIKPIFVDIDPKTLNLDHKKIEEAITPQTTAILAVHCYGTPCNISEIQKIADKHGLKVIYDAAHAFGVQQQNLSILNHGDLSVLSFHATKVFNTFEGGAIICHDLATKQHIDQLKNFGIVDELTVNTSGINGKMSEINAAFGLLQLKYVKDAIYKRSIIDSLYRKGLAEVNGITPKIEACKGDVDNFSYFPILVNNEYGLSRDQLFEKLKDNNIFPRRYFYPLISQFPMYKEFESSKDSNLVIADKTAKNVICLPIYPALTIQQVNIIIEIIHMAAK